MENIRITQQVGTGEALFDWNFRTQRGAFSLSALMFQLILQDVQFMQNFPLETQQLKIARSPSILLALKVKEVPEHGPDHWMVELCNYNCHVMQEVDANY